MTAHTFVHFSQSHPRRRGSLENAPSSAPLGEGDGIGLRRRQRQSALAKRASRCPASCERGALVSGVRKVAVDDTTRGSRRSSMRDVGRIIGRGPLACSRLRAPVRAGAAMTVFPRRSIPADGRLTTNGNRERPVPHRRRKNDVGTSVAEAFRCADSACPSIYSMYRDTG